jgi:hypothetical protein
MQETRACSEWELQQAIFDRWTGSQGEASPARNGDLL